MKKLILALLLLTGSANAEMKNVFKVSDISNSLSATAVSVKLKSGKIVTLTDEHVCGKSSGLNYSDGFMVHIAVVKSVDTKHDLCLLTKLSESGFKIAASYKRGEKVTSVGYPEALFSVSLGVVGGVFFVKQFDQEYVFSTVHSEPGSSGSPVFNSNGEIVGLVSTSNKIGSGLVPLEYIKEFLGEDY